MGLVKNVFAGVAIAGASAVALTGFAVYNAGRYLKKMVYPPTVKKYIALAALPVVLYSVKNPSKVVEGVGGFFSGTRSYASRAIDKYNDSRVSGLQSDIEKLKEEKSSLESLLTEKDAKESASTNYIRAASKNLVNKIGNTKSLELKLDTPLDYFSSIYKNALLVNAEKNKIYLLKSNGERFERVAEYSCTTGKNPLPKQKPGDHATPEGIFYAVLEEAPGWSEQFTSNRLRIGIPKQLGAGILVTGATDNYYLDAISKGLDASNGGVVLTKPDFDELVSAIDFASSENKVPLAIVFSTGSKLVDYTRGGY